MDLSRVRTLAPSELARCIAARRVARGISWLNRAAPPCWHRNLFKPLQHAGSAFRAHTTHSSECVLALAFETRADLANEYGEVTDSTVANHFGHSDLWLRAHGFGGLRDPAQVPDAVLDYAWEEDLRTPRPEWRAPHRHPPRRTGRFREFSTDPTKGVFGRARAMFGQFRLSRMR